jgi:hypothetical protein
MDARFLLSLFSLLLVVCRVCFVRYGINTTGSYTFSSISGMDTYGYLYKGSFDPLNPNANQLAANDNGSTSSSRQFQITTTLGADITYILVFTTYGPSVTGSFRINASGPDDVSLTPIDV